MLTTFIRRISFVSSTIILHSNAIMIPSLWMRSTLSLHLILTCKILIYVDSTSTSSSYQISLTLKVTAYVQEYFMEITRKNLPVPSPVLSNCLQMRKLGGFFYPNYFTPILKKKSLTLRQNKRLSLLKITHFHKIQHP